MLIVILQGFTEEHLDEVGSLLKYCYYYYYTLYIEYHVSHFEHRLLHRDGGGRK